MNVWGFMAAFAYSPAKDKVAVIFDITNIERIVFFILSY